MNQESSLPSIHRMTTQTPIQEKKSEESLDSYVRPSISINKAKTISVDENFKDEQEGQPGGDDKFLDATDAKIQANSVPLNQNESSVEERKKVDISQSNSEENSENYDNIDELDEAGAEFAHLSFLQLIMEKSKSSTKNNQADPFMPRDLGLRSSSSSSSSSSSPSPRSPQKELRKSQDGSCLSFNGYYPKDKEEPIDLANKSASLGISNNNNNENEKENNESSQARKSFFKQNTQVNPDIDKILVNDLIDNETTTPKMVNSFNHKPEEDHWKLCIFELGKSQYHVFKNKMIANYDLPIIPEDETLILCVNFSQKELKSLLRERLQINPILYSECMLLSQVDKILEFNDRAIFYNMVITREYYDDDPIIVRVVRVNNVAVIIVNELENDSFKISENLPKKFKLKQAQNAFNSLRADYNNILGNQNDKDLPGSNDSSLSQDEPQQIVQKGEVGNVIIQRMKTIIPNSEKVTIDSIIFWISNEGLKRIEKLINEDLLREVNSIQDQSRNLGIDSKLEFLQKLDIFQNHYIGAKNAQESKKCYFEEIIKSELPSLEFRYLIRHLKSRMGNLNHTAFIIERRLELARNRFAASIDASISNYSRDLDSLMKKFAVIATIFLPLQLVSGMLGMNLKVPFQTTDSTWPFWALTGVMTLLVLGFWILFKRWKYL
ncbi:unnamed protein product [Moneuplotes crassus]|uniref:Uncharacterized protein n=1 Tax=Euplotes crassus TaxID=5936 RepID=A0AAD2DD00_EUPCR|nr:unnamed protein product [Moneuplotes crassus]